MQDDATKYGGAVKVAFSAPITLNPVMGRVQILLPTANGKTLTLPSVSNFGNKFVVGGIPVLYLVNPTAFSIPIVQTDSIVTGTLAANHALIVGIIPASGITPAYYQWQSYTVNAATGAIFTPLTILCCPLITVADSYALEGGGFLDCPPLSKETGPTIHTDDPHDHSSCCFPAGTKINAIVTVTKQAGSTEDCEYNAYLGTHFFNELVMNADGPNPTWDLILGGYHLSVSKNSDDMGWHAGLTNPVNICGLSIDAIGDCCGFAGTQHNDCCDVIVGEDDLGGLDFTIVVEVIHD